MDSNKGKAKNDVKDQTKVKENKEALKKASNPWTCSDCQKVCDNMSALAVHKSNYHSLKVKKNK